MAGIRIFLTSLSKNKIQLNTKDCYDASDAMGRLPLSRRTYHPAHRKRPRMISADSIRLSAVLAVMLLCGCGDQGAGIRAFGEVTLKGQPLDQGAIEFAPAAGQGSLSGGVIQNGRYEIPASGGLEPGKYTIRITSTTGDAPPDSIPGVDPPPTIIHRIGPGYNTRTKLTAELKQSGENKFDFHIP